MFEKILNYRGFRFSATDMQQRHTNAFITALAFVAFGLFWIFFTDHLFLKITGNDLDKYFHVQNRKGMLFVCLAALLIFWVSARVQRKVDKLNAELTRKNEELTRLFNQSISQDQALKEAYERFEMITKATGDAIWEYNFLTGISYANDALKNTFGYSTEEVQDNFTWWTSNLHPDDKLRVISRTEAALNSTETVWHDEYRLRAKDGSYRTVFDRGFILRDANGRPERLVGAMQDVTLQRRLQQELVNEKVARQKELAQAAIQVQEAERQQLGEELHDNVNQLLATTKLYLEHALSHPDAVPDFVNKANANISAIIEEIRKLSRSLTPPGLADPGLLHAVNELLSDVESAGSLKLSLRTEGIAEDDLSRDKKLAIYRIIQEQMNNILKHASAENVKISLERVDDELVLKISDDGVGFDPDVLRFGVGLRNIRNRAELYGGQMELHSKPGQGTTVSVRIRA